MTLIPLLIFYAISISIGIGIGSRWLDREKMIALVYGTAMRDLSIAVAIAMLSFPGAVLPIALAYAIQVPAVAVIMKVLVRLNEKRRSLLPQTKSA
jgi:predicted Na+-dependent transporter